MTISSAWARVTATAMIKVSLLAGRKKPGRTVEPARVRQKTERVLQIVLDEFATAADRRYDDDAALLNSESAAMLDACVQTTHLSL